LADMVVRGELEPDSPVHAVLPMGLKLQDSAGAAITWADLATHRSGLPRLPSNLSGVNGPDPYNYSRGELYAFLAQWKATRLRNAQWEYSNLGYGLLGEALALRAGSPFNNLLRARVLEPLGLADMHLALRETRIDGLMMGHTPALTPVANWRFDAIAGAGALVGSARSLARYAQAALGLFDHPLKDAFALALQPRAEGPSPQNRIGLAWLSGPLFDRAVFNHDGGTAGYSSSLFIDPERKQASLALANAQVMVNDIALHLLDERAPLRNVAAEKTQTTQSAISVPGESVAPLAGVYALNPQFKLTLRVQGGQLFAQATGQGEFELFAMSPRRWFARVTALEVQFEGDSGAAAALVLHQGGQTMRFVRE
jgi:serine-type D-Ala-D-Ala carboxypeptidase/endopeptidase